MNPEEDSFDTLFEYNLEPEVYTFTILEKIQYFAEKKYNKNLNIHIKIDTGMHRLGFIEADIYKLADIIKSQNKLVVSSIFSHLASADNMKDDTLTEKQINLFESVSSELTSQIGYKPLRHILNTAGIERFGKTSAAYDMVRLGIGIYGVDPTGTIELHPTIKLKTTIIQIREVYKGDSIGYTRNNIASRNMRIAILPIGYADGLRRSLGNGAYKVDILGHPCPIFGNICMDTCIIDVTDYPDIVENDEVYILGSKLTPISTMSKALNTIDYEVLTGIASRVRRTYIYDNSI